MYNNELRHITHKGYQFLSFTKDTSNYMVRYRIEILTEDERCIEVKFGGYNPIQEIHDFCKGKNDRVVLAYGGQDIDFIEYKNKEKSRDLVWSPNSGSYHHFPLDADKMEWLVSNLPYEEGEVVESKEKEKSILDYMRFWK